MADNDSELICYVPALVARRLGERIGDRGEEASVERFPAALLFADISGFTPLANRLDELGVAEGADRLTQMLNGYYGPLVESIAAHGGDIVRFAGDALLAIWPATEEDSLPGQTLRAAQAAVDVQQRLRNYHVDADVELSLRISIAAGEVCAVEVGGINDDWQLLVLGPPLDEIRLADKRAKAGDIILSLPAFERIAASVTGERLSSDLFRLDSVVTSIPPEALSSPEIDAAGREALRRYIPPAVLSMFDAGLGEWLAELRRITTLFIRLSGVEESDDPAGRVHEVMRLLQKTAQAYGGMVLQLMADDKGMVGIIGFGLPSFAHEEDAARAIHAAWMLQDELEGRGMGAGIGISAGRVFCGPLGSSQRREYTVMGSTVNRAARLMQQAGEEILCDEAIRQDARETIAFQPLPRFRLKGITDPIAVFRPQRAKNGSTESSSLVGRKRELATVDEVLEDAGAGRHRVLVIEGEAGIGKSALTAELLARGRAGNLRVAVGECGVLERATLYAPWRTALSQLLALESIMDPVARTERVSSLLTSAPDSLRGMAVLLNPILGTIFPDADGLAAQLKGQVRSDSLHALCVHLIKADSNRSTVIVLDDVQWLDSASWRLVSQVHRVDAATLVLVMRPLAPPVPEEFPPLRDHPAARRIQLGLLDREEIVGLAARRLGGVRLSEEVLRYFSEQTQGNPFFVEELAQYLREAGLLIVVDGCCELRIAEQKDRELIPSSIRELVTSRIDQLRPEEQLTVKVASVIGRMFALRLLQSVHPALSAQEALTRHLQDLVLWDLIRAADEQSELTYLFKHVVIQQVSYDQLPQQQRSRLHRDVARWYETYVRPLSSHYPALADHWSRGEDLEKEMEYLAKAGLDMLDQGAHREAVLYLDKALDRQKQLREDPLPEQERYRRACWTRYLGEAHFQLGDLKTSQRLIEESLVLFGSPMPRTGTGTLVLSGGHLLLQVWHRLGFGFSSRDGALEEGTAPEIWCPESIVREVIFAAERLSQIHYFRSNLAGGTCCALRALNLAERIGHFPAQARAYANMCIVMALVRCPRWAELYARLAGDIARRTGHSPSLAYALSVTSIYRLGYGQWEQARADGDECVTVCERLGDLRRLAEGVCAQALLACFLGDFESSIEDFRRVLEIGRQTDNVLHQAWGLCGEGECQFRLGRLDQATSILEEAETLLSGGRGHTETIRVHGLLAVVHWRSGRMQRGLSYARNTAELVGYGSRVTTSTLEGLASMAEVFFAAWEERPDDQEKRRMSLQACAHLQRYARVFPIGRPRAWRYRGLAEWLQGRPHRARHWWQKSLQAGRQFSPVLETALTHLEIGQHCDARDPRREFHLSEAAEGFDRLKMAYETGQIRAKAELTASGEHL